MQLQALLPFVTYPDAIAESIAERLVPFAAWQNASIHALAINVNIPNVSNALAKMMLDAPATIRRTEAASRDRGEQLLAAVKTKATAQGVNVTTEHVTAPPALLSDTAASHARYFDLSVLGWEAGRETSRMTAEALIFGSGRPAVLVPERSDVQAIKHVAIAWDGSRVAARAVADAHLFLERANRVSILTVSDEKPLAKRDVGSLLAEALRRAGVEAEVIQVEARARPISEALQRTALDVGSGLLVMGGYGHSRLRDFVLGGATQGVLDNLMLPALLSH